MNEHHLGPSRLFVAGFLLFLVVFAVLIAVFGPLVAKFMGAGKAAHDVLIVGIGTGIGGGLIFGWLFASTGRTKTICLATRDPSSLQLAHECLARQGDTVFAQSPSGTTYCAPVAAQNYAQATASDHLSTRLYRFVGERLCGIFPAAFYVHVTDRGDRLQVSGPAQCIRKVERELRTHGVVAS